MISIYKLSIPNRKECYIGSTKRSVHERLLEHKRPGNRCISRNLCKLGEIQIQVMEECDANTRDEREQYWIRNTPGVINKTEPTIQETRVVRAKTPSSRRRVQKKPPSSSSPSVVRAPYLVLPEACSEFSLPFALLPFL